MEGEGQSKNQYKDQYRARQEWYQRKCSVGGCCCEIMQRTAISEDKVLEAFR